MRNTCRDRKFLRDCLTRVSESLGRLIHKAAYVPCVFVARCNHDEMVGRWDANLHTRKSGKLLINFAFTLRD